MTAPVLGQASGDTVEHTINARLTTGESVAGTDIDTLVLYRSGFDASYEEESYVYEPVLKACVADIPFATFEDASVWTFTPAPKQTNSPFPIQVIAEALDSSDVGFRIEQFNLDQNPRIRIVAIERERSERASDWVDAHPDIPLALATIESGEGGQVAMLLGDNVSLTFRLPAEIATPLHFRASKLDGQECQ